MFVSIISVVMMMIDHRQHHLESIRSIFSAVVYPIQYVVDIPTSAGNWVGENLSSRETLSDENKKLKAEQILLRARLLKLAALKVENNRLRELLQSSRKVGENVLIGELLAVDLEPFTKQIVINKGTKDGVFIGQPLLDADGVMGQIVHISPYSSTAMLITDPNHAIPVQVNRNGLRAIVVGTGVPELMEVPYLANSADIIVGDLLTSSGLGGRFPPDYPVATVVSVKKDPAKPYAVITVKPTAQLERSREVLLVWRTQEGRPKVSAPLVGEGEDTPDKPTELEASARPSIPVSPNTITLDAPIVQQDEVPAPITQPAMTGSSTSVDTVEKTDSLRGPEAPLSQNTTKAIEPAVEQPATVEASAPMKKPPVVDSGSSESDIDVEPAVEPKPRIKPTPPSLPFRDQSMPIEEDFVAPSSPGDPPIDEQDANEGDDQ